MLSHTEFPVNPVHATFIRLTAASLSLLIFNIISGRFKEVYEPVATNKNQGLRYAVAGTIFGPVIGVCLSLYTVTFIDPSIAQTIFSLVPAFAFLLAVIFFNEKITIRSMIGLCIAICGVVILIWRDKIGSHLLY